MFSSTNFTWFILEYLDPNKYLTHFMALVFPYPLKTFCDAFREYRKRPVEEYGLNRFWCCHFLWKFSLKSCNDSPVSKQIKLYVHRFYVMLECHMNIFIYSPLSLQVHLVTRLYALIFALQNSRIKFLINFSSYP